MSGRKLVEYAGEPEWRADELALGDLAGTNARETGARTGVVASVAAHEFVTPVVTYDGQVRWGVAA